MISTPSSMQPRPWWIVLGVVALVAAALLGLRDPEGFFAAYLVAFLFWLGITLGSSAILGLHFLVGGLWGLVTRPLFQASTRTMGLVTVFFLPLLFGFTRLYPWTRPNIQDPVLLHKLPYLNPPFFIARAIVYFVVWNVLCYALTRLAVRQDEAPSPERGWSLQKLGAAWVLAYAFTSSLAGVDWVMSMEPRWYSTIFGFLFCVGQLLSAFAFTIVMLCVLAPRSPFGRVPHLPNRLNDLGNLLLTFVMTWAYLAFSQLVVTWAGNLPDDVTWYVHRVADGWVIVAWVLYLFQFALPFFLLLFRDFKRHVVLLGTLAAVVLLAHLFDAAWYVLPAMRSLWHGAWALVVLLTLGLGALWLYAFARNLAQRPVLLPRDARLEEVAHG